MKPLTWNPEKNLLLKIQRNISFEDAVIGITEDRLLDTIQHPNQKKYPGQRIFVVEIDRYAYLVPFVENKETLFLKTIIPSRAATKKYLIN